MHDWILRKCGVLVLQDVMVASMFALASAVCRHAALVGISTGLWQPISTCNQSFDIRNMSIKMCVVMSLFFLPYYMQTCWTASFPLSPSFHKAYCTYYNSISHLRSYPVTSCLVQYPSVVAIRSCLFPCTIHISKPLI